MASALLLTGGSGCGEVVSHTPKVAGAAAAAAGAWWATQQARAEHYRADQEGAKAESLQLDNEAKRRKIASDSPGQSD